MATWDLASVVDPEISEPTLLVLTRMASRHRAQRRARAVPAELPDSVAVAARRAVLVEAVEVDSVEVGSAVEEVDSEGRDALVCAVAPVCAVRTEPTPD